MPDLNVTRKSISSLLSLNDQNSKGKKYVIPEYQRPYKWTIETCDTLWTDFVNFFNDHKNDAREYFLGSIVTCSDTEHNNIINIIDGQQRITSLLLLLRAFYYKLEVQKENNPNDDEVNGLMSQIEPCIWELNPMSRKITDKSNFHVISKVAIDSDCDILKEILETGKRPDNTDMSNYANNYRLFLDKCDEFAKDSLSGWKELCLFILERCIILPIECNDLDSALTIFGTLNNRGLALSDSDIFKAELYKNAINKQEFSDEWKTLESITDSDNFTLDDLFRYYMHIDRALHRSTSKEIGLRNYYAGEKNKFNLFKDSSFFENLKDIAVFWSSVYSYEDTYCTQTAKNYIHCLMNYPNEYWKYSVSVFYQANKSKLDPSAFKQSFEDFLKKILAFMTARFVEKQTVNAIKDKVYTFNNETFKEGTFTFEKNYSMPQNLGRNIKNFRSGKMVKFLLLLNCYLFDNSQKRIEGKCEVEHILPQKWQNTNYCGWNKKDAEVYIDSLGNKIIFEKKLNIQAGNGYFGKKKRDCYKQSKIKEVQNLAQYKKDDWLQEDIENREKEIVNRIMSFLEESIPYSKDNGID